jgi:ribosomal protein L37AE/L43A
MAMMPSMSSTDHGTTCPKCSEALVSPDWSEFVSERLVLNLWTCTTCGDRFETSARLSEDAEFKFARTIGSRCFHRYMSGDKSGPASDSRPGVIGP